MDENLCAICLQNNDSTSLSVKCCKQIFHANCIKYLVKFVENYEQKEYSFKCPMCRANLLFVQIVFENCENTVIQKYIVVKDSNNPRPISLFTDDDFMRVVMRMNRSYRL